MYFRSKSFGIWLLFRRGGGINFPQENCTRPERLQKSSPMITISQCFIGHFDCTIWTTIIKYKWSAMVNFKIIIIERNIHVLWTLNREGRSFETYNGMAVVSNDPPKKIAEYTSDKTARNNQCCANSLRLTHGNHWKNWTYLKSPQKEQKQPLFKIEAFQDSSRWCWYFVHENKMCSKMSGTLQVR